MARPSFSVQHLIFCTSVSYPDVRRPQRNSTLDGVDFVLEVPPNTEFPFEPLEFWLYARIYSTSDDVGETPPLFVTCVWLDAPDGQEVEVWTHSLGRIAFRQPRVVLERGWPFRNLRRRFVVSVPRHWAICVPTLAPDPPMAAGAVEGDRIHPRGGRTMSSNRGGETIQPFHEAELSEVEGVLVYHIPVGPAKSRGPLIPAGDGDGRPVAPRFTKVTRQMVMALHRLTNQPRPACRRVLDEWHGNFASVVRMLRRLPDGGLTATDAEVAAVLAECGVTLPPPDNQP
jgi:hypothetical protein